MITTTGISHRLCVCAWFACRSRKLSITVLPASHPPNHLFVRMTTMAVYSLFSSFTAGTAIDDTNLLNRYMRRLHAIEEKSEEKSLFTSIHAIRPWTIKFTSFAQLLCSKLTCTAMTTESHSHTARDQRKEVMSFDIEFINKRIFLATQTHTRTENSQMGHSDRY